MFHGIGGIAPATREERVDDKSAGSFWFSKRKLVVFLSPPREYRVLRGKLHTHSKHLLPERRLASDSESMGA